MVNVDLYSAIITKVSNALNTLVSGEKPGFQTLSKGACLCSAGDHSSTWSLHSVHHGNQALHRTAD